MDVSSVNSAPVSTILESTPQAPQRQELRSEQERQSSQTSQPQQANEPSPNRSDSRLGSRVDVFA